MGRGYLSARSLLVSRLIDEFPHAVDPTLERGVSVSDSTTGLIGRVLYI
ncbi:MAG: hypothetical protein HWN65_03295 [Candidatus Helarchaeota archaeon]|nr:hypothetical protein [Candidatus Helarchaeota archaeon]